MTISKVTTEKAPTNKKGACVADFDPGFFYNPDFQTTVKNSKSYTTWFLYCLNDYFFEEDTNKDIYGEGTLTRYLGMLGSEIDENIVPYIECLLNIVDAQTTDSKFLNHLAEVLGSPPNITFDEQSFRNLLTYIISIYKVKGTRKSYELFFGLLGYNIQLIELPINENINSYDKEGKYDTTLNYDSDSCQSCSEYDIILLPKDSNKPLTKDVLDRVMRAIELNEPINAKLRNLKMGYVFEDSVKVNILEDVITDTEYINIYDVDKIYDHGEIYDDILQELVPTLIIPMELEITKESTKLDILLRFEKIHQIENIKNTLNITIITQTITGTIVEINTITNYIEADKTGYDTYKTVVNNIPTNTYLYYIRLDIKLKDGSQVTYKSLYKNNNATYKEITELYFS